MMTGTDIIPGAMMLNLIAAVFFLITAVAAGTGRRALWTDLPAAAGFLLLTIHGGMLIFTIRRLPLVGGYESLTVLAWTAAALLLALPRFRRDRAVLVVFGLTLGLLSTVEALAGLQLNHDYFMYASFWSQGFFFFKLLAAGVMLTVALAMIASVLSGRPVFDRGLFMAGAIIFLCSELSGSVWCLLGWGDSWHWSANFFESAMVFFIFMVNLHLPMFLIRLNKWRLSLHLASVMAITGLFIW